MCSQYLPMAEKAKLSLALFGLGMGWELRVGEEPARGRTSRRRALKPPRVPGPGGGSGRLEIQSLTRPRACRRLAVEYSSAYRLDRWWCSEASSERSSAS